ncbi:M6 family metalloprotease domain protein [Kribbella flavida DSM 17836]|uniref:M6 family metalloprotease domain protein n=1 Tax=Kribbella flavida (strain DSM 17836 / JCM 10339 / NBRC 14399) TaxID=479435 RepID=D2PTY7_KRIFD|nr:M6 family metalloprotease domain-containing protein [Kribbella flavida]ADB33270.1 M6 family metalloprotease domain protein [Kribbella flavida DSM 17836]
MPPVPDQRKSRLVLRLATVIAAAAIGGVALAAPAPAALDAAAAARPDPANPWQFDHWPQQQPWQQQQPATRLAGPTSGTGAFGAPIDPQNWENPDHMTWSDYQRPPGTNWADPTKKGSVRTFKGALVLTDYPNQPFVVTQPKGSTPFGNPSAEANGVPRDQVAQFYHDFLNKPNALNRGHTIHEYWMEDSGGRYGVELTAFGPYRMPGKSHEYAMEFQGGTACPAGDTCNRNLRTDGRAAWIADQGPHVPAGFDFVFFMSAGQDESSTWQEFGMMKFPTKEDVTEPFGPPDPNLPNWSRTRYVDWTSWAAGSSIWPNAGGGSSTQAESSGMAVFAHELSHILGIGDNYNNPYGVPPRRAYTGIWEMLSRGSFNGPGGPHSRWMIPATGGASMGAQHMLRNKIKLQMVDEQNVLRLNREALAQSGVVVADVTARVAQPGPTGLAGINVELGGGDLAPACNTATDPLCDGRGYQNYTVEVVDRMGTDSFTPDSGVLLAKTKNQDQAPFEWVIDANSQDINMTDYVLPDGTKVPITIGDYRQLSDALFHAGTNSGSEYEYVDEANRLHFYVTDLERDRQGVLSYTVAVRSLDGDGPAQRGVRVTPAVGRPSRDGVATCNFPLTNTGKAAAAQGEHPEDVSKYLNNDVYRLSATIDGRGWSVNLPNALTTAATGKRVTVPVQAKHAPGSAALARVTLTAISESDPTKKSTTSCLAIAR